MRRSVPFRLAAWIAAVILSLSAPGLALAHGIAHDHLARHHARSPAEHHAEHDAEHHPEHHTGRHAFGPAVAGNHHGAAESAARALRDHDTGEVAPADHGHGHAHATVDVAPGARDPGALDLTVGSTVRAAALPPHTADLVVRSPARSDRALLARPDPRAGPPPSLRAPPVC